MREAPFKEASRELAGGVHVRSSHPSKMTRMHRIVQSGMLMDLKFVCVVQLHVHEKFGFLRGVRERWVKARLKRGSQHEAGFGKPGKAQWPQGGLTVADVLLAQGLESSNCSVKKGAGHVSASWDPVDRHSAFSLANSGAYSSLQQERQAIYPQLLRCLVIGSICWVIG